MYELLKYVHVLAAIVWVGGAFFIVVLTTVMSRSSNEGDLPAVSRHLAFLGSRVFPVASIVLFVAGVVLVLQRWSFGQLWISVSTVLWLVSVLVGALYISPRSAEVGRLWAQEGLASVAARRHLSRVFLVSRLELVSFAVIVFLMVAKPGV